jgi:hypothetical protein
MTKSDPVAPGSVPAIGPEPDARPTEPQPDATPMRGPSSRPPINREVSVPASINGRDLSRGGP